MLSEYDKHLIIVRHKDGWGITELAWDMHEHHNYSDYKKEVEDYLKEEGL